MITFMENLKFRPNVHRKDATRLSQIIFFEIKKNSLSNQCNLWLNELTKKNWPPKQSARDFVVRNLVLQKWSVKLKKNSGFTFFVRIDYVNFCHFWIIE